MWTAERGRRIQAAPRSGAADCGVVTVGGNPAGAYLDGDRRWMQVYGPGGYSWMPAQGENVLVIKAGEDAEYACVAGTRQEARDLAPGEVRVRSAGGAKISLQNDGSIVLSGQVRVNGMELRSLIAQVCRETMGLE